MKESEVFGTMSLSTYMGSMAPHRPLRTEKPVTLAKVKPRAPPAKLSSPRRPKNAVVMAVLANQAKFMATIGRAIPR